MSQDVTLLLRALLTVEYMATHRHTRAILYIALFLNLAVDCSGRIGELLIIGGKLCEGKCLRWRDIEIYAFRLADGNITLKASVRYANLKGSSGQATKEQRAKVIPLRLMPLHLAAEDSLRLLVTLGMIDDVFEHIQSWQDIQYLNPGPHGSQVAIRKTSLPLPVSNHQSALPAPYFLVEDFKINDNNFNFSRSFVRSASPLLSRMIHYDDTI